MAEQKPATALSAKVDKKRKRHAEEQSKAGKADGTTTAGNASTDGPSKKRKKNKEKYNKNKDKKNQEKKDQQDKPSKPGEPLKEREGKDDIDESIRMMNGALLADHFAQRTKKFNKEITAVELNDLHVPGE